MRLLTKYLSGFIGINLFFGTFIACGTQAYKVSMKEDYDPSRGSAATSDKSSSLYGIHATSGWKQLPIPFRFSPELNVEQKSHLMAAMKRWEWATGKKLFSYEGEHSGTNGDSFKDLYSSLRDGINGHYLDGNWAKTQKPEYVLATTIWDNERDASVIARADIRCNNQYYIIGDSLTLKSTESKEVVDMQSLALHELGHLLGLAHVDEDVDSLSIMNPALFIGEGLTSRKVSRSDIERIQQIYGCEGKACNIDGLMDELETANWDRLTMNAKKWMQSKGVSPSLE